MIRADTIRVIGANGEQLGILTPEEAMKKAAEDDLDLVEVSPNAEPPVCRIMNFGKYKYELQKKEHASRRKNQAVEMKDLRLGRSIGVEDHDLDVKLKKARELLVKGHRLSVFIQVRGREMSHSDLGVDSMLKFAESLSDIAKLESSPRRDGRRIHMVIAPLPNLSKLLEKQQKVAGKPETELDSGAVDTVDSDSDNEPQEPAASTAGGESASV